MALLPAYRHQQRYSAVASGIAPPLGRRSGGLAANTCQLRVVPPRRPAEGAAVVTAELGWALVATRSETATALGAPRDHKATGCISRMAFWNCSGPILLTALNWRWKAKRSLPPVVTPDPLNGRQLAEEAVRRRPGTMVLYTIGCIRNPVVHDGRLNLVVHLASKRFTYRQLAERVGGCRMSRGLRSKIVERYQQGADGIRLSVPRDDSLVVSQLIAERFSAGGASGGPKLRRQSASGVG